MGWSEIEGRCKRHPSHRQSKGVCPTCLREKLSQISASSSGFSSPGTSYDSVSSAASSSSSSPAAAIPGGAVAAKMAIMAGKPEPLTKSRSLAFVVTGGKREKKGKSKEEDDHEEKSKKAIVAAAAAAVAVAEEERGEVEAQKEAAAAAAEEEEKKKKKRGFWSRLAISVKKKREKDVLFHSKTVRETSSTRWAFLS